MIQLHCLKSTFLKLGFERYGNILSYAALSGEGTVEYGNSALRISPFNMALCGKESVGVMVC